MKYLVLLVIFQFVGTCFLITDAYLKCKQARKDKDQADINYEYNKRQMSIFFFIGGISDTPDYRKPFSVRYSVRWSDLIAICTMVAFLLTWCFQFKFKQASYYRKKLVYVEVQDKKWNISRVTSKQNLQTVIEVTKRYTEDYKLFDKFWYQTRVLKLFAPNKDVQLSKDPNYPKTDTKAKKTKKTVTKSTSGELQNGKKKSMLMLAENSTQLSEICKLTPRERYTGINSLRLTSADLDLLPSQRSKRSNADTQSAQTERER